MMKNEYVKKGLEKLEFIQIKQNEKDFIVDYK